MWEAVSSINEYISYYKSIKLQTFKGAACFNDRTIYVRCTDVFHIQVCH